MTADSMAMEHNPTALCERPPWLLHGRVPSLDGFRGLSILFVLWHHIIVTRPQIIPRYLAWTSELGALGVDFFFVISGFLITLLLIREERRTGDLSIRSFYLRRFFRIVPAYVTYVVVVRSILSFTSARLTRTEWMRVFTYTMSFGHLPSWYIGHFWSLSVEEHFYLIWPLLFVTVPKRHLITITLGYSFIAILFRCCLYKYMWVPANGNFFTLTRADAIAVGCALAVIATSRFQWILLTPAAIAGGLALLSSAILISACFLIERHSRFASRFSAIGFRFVVEWCIVVIIWAGLYHSASLPGRLLNWKPLTAIGVLSYSIYLWQQAFLGPSDRFGYLDYREICWESRSLLSRLIIL
jgi:peptidoglycan/LPS O-acetylase OafA/YrhL